MRELSKSVYYRPLEALIRDEIYKNTNKAGLMSLFSSITNYFIGVGMKRIIELIELESNFATSYENKNKGK